MSKPAIHNVKHLKGARTQLRKTLTPAEAILWNGLKNSNLGNKKFRRQHSILNYIVDFYCPEERLIIELDGNHHFLPGGTEHDAERDAALMALGFKILRYENEIVIKHSAEVLENIASHFNNP